MNMFRSGPLTALLAAALLAPAAHAQYVWIDKSGTRQYSDQPPPTDVPRHRILKQPRAQVAADAAATPEPAATGENAAATAAPLTTAERNAEFNKRRMERLEQEKKDAEQARMAAAKAENCGRARRYRQVLESGVRITSADANGERVYLNDAQRAAELRKTQQILKDCG
jgi:hypothetical protein